MISASLRVKIPHSSVACTDRKSGAWLLAVSMLSAEVTTDPPLPPLAPGLTHEQSSDPFQCTQIESNIVILTTCTVTPLNDLVAVMMPSRFSYLGNRQHLAACGAQALGSRGTAIAVSFLGEGCI